MGRKANRPEGVWRYIEKRGYDECWPWTMATQKGYPVYSIGHENYRVGRILCWLRDNDEISLRAIENSAERLVVLHSCDNPTCCNPAHLSVGKALHNTRDMIAKGRRADMRGENGGNSKLSNEAALRIRESRLFGASQKDLAHVHNVSVPTISAVCNHKIFQGIA